MSKVAKNIKRLRTENGLTQQDLAQKLHVTRQTLSSWETNRTQPDIETLGILAEIFSVELEELIYGKKRRKDGEEKPSYSNTLIVVLSVIGCLFISVGAVLIIVKYWQELPDGFKLLLCFLPALIGQFLGLFTFFKKRDSIPWCEGISILWIIGVVATTYMLLNSHPYIKDYDNGIFNIILGCLLFAILPLLKSFSPVIAFFGYGFTGFNWLYSQHIDFNLFSLSNSLFDIIKFIAVTVAYFGFMLFGLYFASRYFKKEANILRYTFFNWISFFVITALPFMPLLHIQLTACYLPIIITTMICCYLFIGESHTDFFSPYKFFALPLSAVIMCVLSVFGFPYDDEKSFMLVFLVLPLLPLCFLFFEKTRPKEKLFTVYSLLFCAVSILNALITAVCIYVSRDNPITEGTTPENILFSALQTLNIIVILSAFVVLIICGAKQRKLYYINLGFLGSCAVIISQLALMDIGLIGIGLLFILFGSGLLALNLKISKLKKKEEEEKNLRLLESKAEEE